jgi:hypothetical protein
MRYATTPGWVYVMLIVMGVGFMGGSAAFMRFVPQPTGATVGAIWLVMGAGFVFFSVRALRGRRDDERIRRQGTPATATVLAARMTGMLVNNVPQWALQLRIDGAGASYETKLNVLTFTPPDDGATMSVRVDPMKRNHVVLSDDDGAGAPSRAGNAAGLGRAAGAAPQVQAAVLEALRQAGLAQGETAVVNADGSRTITTSSVTIGGDDDGGGPADTVRLLSDLDKLRADGSLSEAEFAAVKAKLLGRL